MQYDMVDKTVEEENMIIVSDLQNGADQWGLDWAKQRGVTHIGRTHRDFVSVEGERLTKLFNEYNIEIVSEWTGIFGLKDRTRYNVQNSDITLIFIDNDIKSTRGSRLTQKIALKSEKVHEVIPLMFMDDVLPRAIVDIYEKFDGTPRIVNVAGQRKFRTPDAKKKMFKCLDEILIPFLI